jgi:hypothetical protein
LVDHPLPALHGRGLMILVLRVGWRVWVKLYTPAGLNLFRKAVSTVMDDLVMDSVIIENFNLIIKFGNNE